MSLPISKLIGILYFLTSLHSYAQDFPENWQGHWKGSMQLSYANGKTMEVNNELIIIDITTEQDTLKRYQWTVIYGDSSRRQERTYELITLDAQKGLYQIDEKNSIVLPCFYTDNTLMSLFEVMGNYIMSTYRKQGDYIYFENISASGNKKRVTGAGEEDIPEVTTYPLSNFQRAKLGKIGE